MPTYRSLPAFDGSDGARIGAEPFPTMLPGDALAAPPSPAP
jgi:hypothetical protein